MYSGAIKLGPTKLAGGSSGSIVAASYCGGADLGQMAAALFLELEKCGDVKGARNCIGNIHNINAALLDAVLPEGSQYQDCNGNMSIQYTLVKYPPDGLCGRHASTEGIIGSHLINQFYNRSDLINAMGASSWIRGFSDPVRQCSYEFRGEYCEDAGYSLDLPCPVGFTNCLKISGQPPQTWESALGNATIYPGIYGWYPYGMSLATFEKDDGNFGCNPIAVNKHKYALFEAGMNDTKHWLAQNWNGAGWKTTYT